MPYFVIAASEHTITSFFFGSSCVTCVSVFVVKIPRDSSLTDQPSPGCLLLSPCPVSSSASLVYACFKSPCQPSAIPLLFVSIGAEAVKCADVASSHRYLAGTTPIVTTYSQRPRQLSIHRVQLVRQLRITHLRPTRIIIRYQLKIRIRPTPKVTTRPRITRRI